MYGNGKTIRINLDTKNYYIELDEYSGSVRMNLKRFKAGVKDHGSVNLTYDDMEKLITMLREMQDYINKKY